MDNMNKPFKEMSYKEFCSFCNKRACDGQWSMGDALGSIGIMNHINSIKVKSFGLYNKKKTEQAREKAWKEFIWE